MRIVLVLLLAYYSVNAFATDPVRKIAKANEAKELASKAFGTGDYATAIEQYNFLIDSLGYEDEALILNRAHAYFQSKDTLSAFDNYRAASMAEQPAIQAAAFSQLGVLSEQKQQQKEALSYYKEALRADPTNQEARYNYELLKKKLQEQEQQKEQNKDKNQEGQDKDQQDQQDKDKQDKQEGDKSKGDSEEDKSKGEDDKSEAEEGDKKEQQDKEQEGKDQEGEQKEGEQKEGEQSEGEAKSEQDQKAKEGEEMKPSTSEKLKAMNVSQEKAKQILEALRNKEAQYLQQNRKRATQKEDKGKPDW